MLRGGGNTGSRSAPKEPEDELPYMTAYRTYKKMNSHKSIQELKNDLKNAEDRKNIAKKNMADYSHSYLRDEYDDKFADAQTKILIIEKYIEEREREAKKGGRRRTRKVHHRKRKTQRRR